MHKNLLALLFVPVLLTGCTQTDHSKDKKEYEVLSISFNNFAFEGKTKEICYSEDNTNFQDAMKNYFTAVSQDEGLLTEVEAEVYAGLKMQENTTIEDGKTTFNTLQISSQNYNGSVTFKFSKIISAIEISAQAYYKCFVRSWDPGVDPYNCYSIDLDTTVLINGKNWTLPSVTQIEGEEGMSIEMPQIDKVMFDINSDTLTISDDNNLGRFFIHNINFVLEK